MLKFRIRPAILFTLFLQAGAMPVRAAEFVDKRFEFSRTDTQEHFWLSAGGTFIGTQVFRFMDVPRRQATWAAGGTILTLGICKEFFIDPQVSVNDLTADALGVLLGTLATITFRFNGYFDDEPLPDVPGSR